MIKAMENLWFDALDDALDAYAQTGDYDEFAADCQRLGLDHHEIRQQADAIDEERARECQKTSG